MKTLNEFLLEREIKGTKSKPLTKEELKEMIKNNEDITYVNTSEISNMQDLFKNNKNITKLNLSNWDTSKVIEMDCMFSDCLNLISVILGDTSKVWDMSWMFNNCHKLEVVKLNNLSNVTDVSGMFYSCSEFKQNLNDWSLPKLEHTISTFEGSGLENRKPKWYRNINENTK